MQSFHIQEVVIEILAGRRQIWLDLYKKYKPEFITWATHRFSVDDQVAIDIFQEVMLAFYEQVKYKGLRTLQCDLKTWFWSIGKNHLIMYCRKNGRIVTFDHQDAIKLIETIPDSMSKKEDNEHTSEMVKKHLQLLDEKSRDVLTKYYIEGKSMAVIASEMGFKNSDVAKKKKYEIMKKLAALLVNKQKLMSII